MSSPSPGIPAAAPRHGSRRLRSGGTVRACWAASVAFVLGAAGAAEGMTPLFPKGVQSGSAVGFSTDPPVPAQAPPPPARPDDPSAGGLFNTADPSAPGAVPPRGARSPRTGAQP